VSGITESPPMSRYSLLIDAHIGRRCHFRSLKIS
jgi:hypothetical protein